MWQQSSSSSTDNQDLQWLMCHFLNELCLWTSTYQTIIPCHNGIVIINYRAGIRWSVKCGVLWPLVPPRPCCRWGCPPRSLCWGSSRCPGPHWPRWSSGSWCSAEAGTPSWLPAPRGGGRRMPPGPCPGREGAGGRWWRGLSWFSGCCWLLSWQR